MRLFFLIFICLVPLLAPAQEVQNNLQIIAQRQSDSDHAQHLVLDKGTTKAWTTASHGPLSISVKPGRWLLSGIINSPQELQAAWNKANQESSGLPSTLVLDYAGGDTAAAMWLARQVQDNGISTQVPDWGVCLSSCVYVLAAGNDRRVGPWSVVGIHAQNSSAGITEQLIRQEAAKSPALRQALEGQSVGSGENTVLPLNLILDIVDNVSRTTQLRDGELAYVLASSGVSPLLLTYATRVAHTRTATNVRVLYLPCIEALGLASASGTARAKSPTHIQSACGQLE